MQNEQKKLNLNHGLIQAMFLKRGLAQAHKDRAEAHAEAKAFCDWYISNEQTIYEISNSEAVKNGKKFINDVLDGKYVTK